MLVRFTRSIVAYSNEKYIFIPMSMDNKLGKGTLVEYLHRVYPSVIDLYRRLNKKRRSYLTQIMHVKDYNKEFFLCSLKYYYYAKYLDVYVKAALTEFEKFIRKYFNDLSGKIISMPYMIDKMEDMLYELFKDHELTFLLYKSSKC